MAIHGGVQADQLVSITPSDSTIFDPPLVAVWVGVGGAVAIRAEKDGAAVTLVAVPTGYLLPIRISRLMATNTDATTMVGFR